MLSIGFILDFICALILFFKLCYYIIVFNFQNAHLGVNSVLYFITAKTIHTVDMKTGEFLENLDLPDGFLFSEIYLDDETGLLAVSSQKKFEKKIDILMVIVLYQCDTYLMFLQLLEVFTFF